APVLPKTTTRTYLWPMGNTPKFAGGPVNASPMDTGSFAYRVIYKLERAPSWYPHLDDYSDYEYNPVNENVSTAGLYQLTLVVYRDLDRKGGRLEQLTQPMIVYLRD